MEVKETPSGDSQVKPGPEEVVQAWDTAGELAIGSGSQRRAAGVQ